MKVCCTCQQEKLLSDFNKNQDRCRVCCKQWYKDNKDKHRANIKKNRVISQERARMFVYNYLTSHPCVDCGENDPIILTFDHVRDTKVDNISRMVCTGASTTKILTEIEKCDVRCANCHMRRTAFQYSWWITNMPS